MSYSPQPSHATRVVVVGLGAVTSQGHTAESLWQGVKAGRVAISPVCGFDMTGLRTKLGGEVADLARPEHEYADSLGVQERVCDFALRAAEEAFAGSGLGFDSIPAHRWGLVLATTVGGLGSLMAWYRGIMEDRPPDPKLLLVGPPQTIAEGVAGLLGLGGPVLSVTNACAAGANAVGLAADLIVGGQADAMLAGGVDGLNGIVFAGFNSIMALSPKPAAPYSRGRDGLSLGEGCGLLALVREDLARELGTPILAEVLGYGLSADGYNSATPHPRGEGVARAMRAAMKDAGVTPEEVGYVNGHGTGTQLNDPAESQGIRLALGAAADLVSVSSSKSMTGHLLAGAGAIEAIITVRALQDQVAPPTANYSRPDPECDLDFVPNVARPIWTDVALSNNSAFGGSNTSLALGRYRPHRTRPRLERDRVVVTGIAILTDTASYQEAVWRTYVSGYKAVPEYARFRPANVASQFLPPKILSRLDRQGIVSVVSSQLALTDAGMTVSDDNRDRIGIILGSGLGTMESMEVFGRPVLSLGPNAANPVQFANLVHNQPAGQATIRVGALGPTTSLTAGDTAGSAVVAYAYELLSRCRADAIVCIATDTVTETVLKAYRALGLIPETQETPLVEACVAIVLERLSIAQMQGARYYGEILGYGIASDATGFGSFDPRGYGLDRAMRRALEMAAMMPQDIGVIWANASGHRASDVAERAALRRVFKGRPEVLAPKAVLGNPMAAGGPLTIALASKKWEHEPGEWPPRPALINSSSLGGTHTSIVLGPPSS